MTPSAARNIFQAIFWKPAINWVVKRIEILRPIKWVSVKRNEVAALASKSGDGVFIEDKRQQKSGTFLKDVRYRIYAELDFIPPSKRPKRERKSALSDAEERGFRTDEKPRIFGGAQVRRKSEQTGGSPKYAGMGAMRKNRRLQHNI